MHFFYPYIYLTNQNQKFSELHWYNILQITITVNNTDHGRAVHLLSHYRYKNGVKLLLNTSRAARRATVHAMSDVIRKEIKNFASRKRTEENAFEIIKNFKWSSIISEAQRKCPMLLECLTASVTKKHYHKTMSKRKGKNIISLQPVIGSLLCIIAHTRSRHYSILQHLVSIMMWLGGCKRKVYVLESLFINKYSRTLVAWTQRECPLFSKSVPKMHGV